MTDRDYKQQAYYLIHLIRCVLNNKVPSKEKLDKMDLSRLYTVAKKHSLTAITAYALESAGIFDKEFEEAKNKAIRKNILLDTERMRLLGILEKEGIWYMPLKGSILKDMYPQMGMRQMADNDILFDISRREDVRRIMDDLGFKLKAEREVVDEYTKEPVYNFEMHGELFMEYQVGAMADYYLGIKERMVKDDDNGFGYHFSHEEFYLFMLAHEYKHFILSGTGIRSLLDTYVFLKKYGDELDRSYVDAELGKMGIAEYELKSRELSMKLFDGIKLGEEESDLLDYYIFSGTYGSVENIVNKIIKKNGSGSSAKIKYIVKRITVPYRKDDPDYQNFEMAYPFFYKHKILLPLLPLYRLINSVIEHRDRIFSELKALIKH